MDVEIRPKAESCQFEFMARLRPFDFCHFGGFDERPKCRDWLRLLAIRKLLGTANIRLVQTFELPKSLNH